jgi:amidase
MNETPSEARGYDRKEFLGMSAAAAASMTMAAAAAERALAAPALELEEVTIAELQARMTAGDLTARELVEEYIERIEAIDGRGPRLNAVLELNPQAEAIARQLDRERRQGNVRGPLHGIPIIVKDNIDTADRMQTAAGSLALVGRSALQDSTIAAKLRQAGVVILGKANLSEWANFRSFFSSSGWSGRAGQNRNPYVINRNPCGSSSGSGVAASANECAATIGTETDGSIVCPSSANGVVGIKPTVGLTSRAGVVPIAASQDTVGPHGRTVADAAAVLGAIASKTSDPRDPATIPNRDKVFTDYTQFLDEDGLRGARIGVPRDGFSFTDETNAVFEATLQAISDAGATVVDPADIPTIGRINEFVEELIVLVFEFKRDLNAYLATRTGVPIRTLADAIQFNLDHAEVELRFFGQEWFELAEAEIFSEAQYLVAAPEARRIGGPDGIDAALAANSLDALVAPTGSPAWSTDLVNGDHFDGSSSSPAAIAGYPLINVPAGNAFGLPVGISFMAGAFSEPKLIKLASGFEAATKARRKPEFRATIDDNRGPRDRDDFRVLSARGSLGHGSHDRAPSMPLRQRAVFGLQ